MVDKLIGNPVNPALIEDEVRDTYRFTQGIELPSVSMDQVMKYPLRSHLARVGQWTAGLVTLAGLGYGISVAPYDTVRMGVSITVATFACISAMSLKAYADRQLPVWKK